MYPHLRRVGADDAEVGWGESSTQQGAHVRRGSFGLAPVAGWGWGLRGWGREKAGKMARKMACESTRIFSPASTFGFSCFWYCTKTRQPSVTTKPGIRPSALDTSCCHFWSVVDLAGLAVAAAAGLSSSSEATTSSLGLGLGSAVVGGMGKGLTEGMFMVGNLGKNVKKIAEVGISRINASVSSTISDEELRIYSDLVIDVTERSQLFDAWFRLHLIGLCYGCLLLLFSFPLLFRSGLLECLGFEGHKCVLVR